MLLRYTDIYNSVKYIILADITFTDGSTITNYRCCGNNQFSQIRTVAPILYSDNTR